MDDATHRRASIGFLKSLMIAAIVAIATLVASEAPAAAAKPRVLASGGGVISACYKAKGSGSGAVRIVRSARQCTKRHGWRSLSWNVRGPEGTVGSSGATGTTGAQGPTGQTETSVLETIKSQSAEIKTLTQQVSTLAGEVTGLEGTLISACSQLAKTTTQINSVSGAVGGLSLNSTLLGLGGSLSIPTLPTALPAYSCP